MAGTRGRRDPYSVLGIDATVSFDDARAKYRRLAEIFHPDRFADARPEIREEAERQMIDLNLAWEAVRERMGRFEDTASTPRGRTSARTDAGTSWADLADRPSSAESDFGARARHARTKERARRRREDAEAAGSRAPDPPPRDERDEFIRQAQERLRSEERDGRA